jgi:DNA-binding transcriptional ArsR family regulator
MRDMMILSTFVTYVGLARCRQNATFLIYVNIHGIIGFMPKALPIIDMSAPVCCAPVAAGPMSDDDALHVALRLKALADPARVKIMSYLFSSPAGEETSGDLAVVLALTESTVSHHLAQLRRAGLVESDRRGMNVFHRAHRDAVGALCAVLDPNCCS